MTDPLLRCTIYMANGDIVNAVNLFPDDLTQADGFVTVETHTGTVWLNPQHVTHFTERL